MVQAIYKCPFCDDAPAWRTRYMLWRHIHECLGKSQRIPASVGSLVAANAESNFIELNDS